MTRMRYLVAVGGASAFLFAQVPARAQSAAAQAEILFQDGKRLFDAGQTHAACEKFASSQQLDPGLGTLLHLAACHEKEGKTASAWAEYTDALAQAQDRGEKDREKFAREHAQALEKALHRVVLEMMNKPAGLELKLDGKAFPVGSLGTAIPLDPGEHQIEVKATGKKPWSQTLRLGPSAVTERIEIPALEDDASAPAPSGRPGEDRSATGQPPAGGSPGDPTKRWIGIGLGVAGIALGVTAGVEFATASSRQNSSQTHAQEGDKPGADTLHSQAITAQTYGWIFAVTGAAALGVGVVLVITSFGSTPAKAGLSVAPMVGQGVGGLAAVGTF